MTVIALELLRARLKADGLDGFVVPLTDEHMSAIMPKGSNG